MARRPPGTSTLKSRLLAKGALPHPVVIADVKLMHPSWGTLPLTPGWIYEIKADGYRVLAGRQRGRAHIRYRRGSEGTSTWPELAAILDRLPFERLILDAELVVPEEGRPRFSLVQERFGISRPRAAQQAAQNHPAQLLVFDLLAVDELDLRVLPLLERKEALRTVVAGAGPFLQYVDHVDGDGTAFYRQARELGGEDVVAKRSSSRYQAGRSREWIKARQSPTTDFVAVGYSLPGQRGAALHLGGFHVGGTLLYVGAVKAGLPRGFINAADTLLRSIRRPSPPCQGVAADVAEHWVEPRIVVEVAYVEATPGGILRHAEFGRLRPDKTPAECVLPEGFGAGIDGRPLHRRGARW